MNATEHMSNAGSDHRVQDYSSSILIPIIGICQKLCCIEASAISQTQSSEHIAQSVSKVHNIASSLELAHLHLLPEVKMEV